MQKKFGNNLQIKPSVLSVMIKNKNWQIVVLVIIKVKSQLVH